MKRSIIFAILIALVFSLGACGSSVTPSEVVDNYLEAAKAQDTEALDLSYAGDVEDMDFSSSDSALGTDDFEYLSDAAIEEKMLDFDYAIVDEKISKDEKTATVDVSITSYAFGTMVENLMTDAISEAFSNMFDEDYDIEEYMEKEMASQMKKLKKDYNETVSIDLEKDDNDEWVVSEISDDSPLLNAITGGLFESIESLEDAFSE